MFPKTTPQIIIDKKPYKFIFKKNELCLETDFVLRLNVFIKEALAVS